MPYKQVWFDAPSDMSIPVIPGDDKTPPDGYTMSYSPAYPEAMRDIQQVVEWVKAHPDEKPDKPIEYYYCRHCGGWIEGLPNQYTVNTLAPLSGRKGEAFNCRRCGREIGFFGMVS